MNVLNILNNLFVRLQRWKQGIPAGSAHLYNWLATRLLEESYSYVVKDIDKEKIDKILEIDHGPGRLLIELAMKNTYDLLIGIDISKAMAYIARRNFICKKVYGSLNSVVADAHMMPFRNKFFDLIVSTGTLYHIRNPAVFFRECIRVVKDGGFAWIYELSHDVSDDELSLSSKNMKKSKFMLRITAALHGLPRREYNQGYIRDALIESSIKYRVMYNGVITKLILIS